MVANAGVALKKLVQTCLMRCLVKGWLLWRLSVDLFLNAADRANRIAVWKIGKLVLDVEAHVVGVEVDVQVFLDFGFEVGLGVEAFLADGLK